MVLAYLGRGVFQYDGEQGERRRRSVSDGSFRNEGGPVAVQCPLLHPLDHGQQAVQRPLAYAGMPKPDGGRKSIAIFISLDF